MAKSTSISAGLNVHCSPSSDFKKIQFLRRKFEKRGLKKFSQIVSSSGFRALSRALTFFIAIHAYVSFIFPLYILIET